MGTSKSMKTDLAAEAPWRLGGMCVSSFILDFSHTLSQKLESCMENLVLGRGTTKPSALSPPHPFQSPNQKRGRKTSGQMNGTTVHNGVAEEGAPGSRSLGKGALLGMAEPVNSLLLAWKSLSHGLERSSASWKNAASPGDL